MSFTKKSTNTHHMYHMILTWYEDPTVQYEIGLACNVLLSGEQSENRVRLRIESYELTDIIDEMKRNIFIVLVHKKVTIDVVPHIHSTIVN